MIKLTGKVEINLRNKYIQQLTVAAAEDVMLELAEDTQKQAKINVAPSMGPGPHPHITPHIDTGELRESLQVDVTRAGDVITATVSTAQPYGAYLELGWQAANGRFVRYPWLLPALKATVPPWQVRAGRKFRVLLEGK